MNDNVLYEPRPGLTTADPANCPDACFSSRWSKLVHKILSALILALRNNPSESNVSPVTHPAQRRATSSVRCHRIREASLISRTRLYRSGRMPLWIRAP